MRIGIFSVVCALLALSTAASAHHFDDPLFSVDYPRPPQHAKRTDDQNLTTGRVTHQVTADDGPARFVITVVDWPGLLSPDFGHVTDPKQRARLLALGLSELLHSTLEALAHSLGGKVDSQATLREQDTIGLDAGGRVAPDRCFRARIYVRGERLYTVLASVPDDAASSRSADAFVCSFRLRAAAAPQPSTTVGTVSAWLTTKQSKDSDRAVRAWLTALQSKDYKKLEETSAIPFTFATDYKNKKCDGTAKDESSLAKIFRCILTDEKILIEELQYKDQNLHLEGADSKGVDPVVKDKSTLRKLAGRLGSADGQTTVQGFLNGDGITFEFIFAVRPVGESLKVSGVLLQFEVIE